jgi:hypothetical protein
MWSNILLLVNSEMAGRHPQFPLLKSFWDSKHRACLIAEGRVSVDSFLYVFYYFCEYVLAVGANIFALLLCSTPIAPTQDPHAQPPNMG